MKKHKIQLFSNLLPLLFIAVCINLATGATSKQWPALPVKVEYILPGKPLSESIEIPVANVINSSNTRITTYVNARNQQGLLYRNKR
jgi:hypothetical protein